MGELRWTFGEDQPLVANRGNLELDELVGLEWMPAPPGELAPGVYRARALPGAAWTTITVEPPEWMTREVAARIIVAAQGAGQRWRWLAARLAALRLRRLARWADGREQRRIQLEAVWRLQDEDRALEHSIRTHPSRYEQ